MVSASNSCASVAISRSTRKRDALCPVIPPQRQRGLLNQLRQQRAHRDRLGDGRGVNHPEMVRRLDLPLAERDVSRIDAGIVLQEVAMITAVSLPG